MFSFKPGIEPMTARPRANRNYQELLQT